MRRESAEAVRERTAVERIQASGWLRQEYDSYLEQPLPERLADLLRQIAQPTE